MLKHKGTLILETERLILRKFKQSDAENMFKNWATDSEVCKFLSWNPHKDLNETKQIVEGWVSSYTDTCYNWAIELKAFGEIIGQISLMDHNEKYLSCTLGYNIGKAFWSKGYMTEALEVVISYLLKEIGMNRIEARHNTLNPASGRVMQKSGMKLEGILRQAKIDKHGEFYDLAVYSILWSDIWRGEMITIKPHHFLDIIKLYGLGIERFVPDEKYHHNFYSIANEIIGNKQVQIKITIDADDICGPCKFIDDQGICSDNIDHIADIFSKDEWNKILDKRIIEYTGISVNDIISASEYCKMLFFIKERIFEIWKEEKDTAKMHRYEAFCAGAKKYLGFM